MLFLNKRNTIDTLSQCENIFKWLIDQLTDNWVITIFASISISAILSTWLFCYIQRNLLYTKYYIFNIFDVHLRGFFRNIYKQKLETSLF